MSENIQPKPDSSELSSTIEEQIAEIPSQPKRSFLSRLGCGFLLVIWFVVLMTPCALLYIASNGEIRIGHTDIPDAHEHPRLSIEVVTEVDSRGFRIVNSSVVDNMPDDNALCVQTNVRFLLWRTSEDSQDTSYCDCYERDTADSAWTFDQTKPDICPSEP
jgi:hypothetical protein